jgi:hypothetical protein
VPKNLRLVSIHDVLTSREARSDPTVSRDHLPAGRSTRTAPPTSLELKENDEIADQLSTEDGVVGGQVLSAR